MRIAHVNIARAFSGGERQTLNLIGALQQAGGCEQLLICRPGSPMIGAIRAMDGDVQVHTASHPLAGHGRRLYPEDSLLHAHCGKSIHWCAAEHLLRRVPYLMTRRVDNPLAGKLTTRYSYGHAVHIVCLSRAIEAAVHRLLPQAPTSVIPSSASDFDVDAAAVQALRRRFAGRRLAGQVGKLLPHKGAHVTLEAARRLAARRRDVQVLLIGDGPERAGLEAAAAGLDNVTFLGHRQDVGNCLAALDVLLFPSLSEGLGSVILEAWQHDVPVVAAAAGGVPDLITHERTGLLVPPGDAGALATALERALDDEALRRRLVAGAAERLQEHAPLAIARRYLALYRTLASAGA